MLPPSELPRFRPVFATPCYDGKLTSLFFRSFMALSHDLARRGMDFDLLFVEGESLVTRARNKLVAQFLANERATHLFWIDSDIGFSVEAAIRLLLADKDVVAGVYPLKKEVFPSGGPRTVAGREDWELLTSRFPVNTGSTAPAVELQIDADGFMAVGEAPTGFMAIRRGVFDKMAGAYPELKLTWEEEHDPRYAPHYYAFFDVMIEPETRLYLSEDYAFSKRWRTIGGLIHVDTHSHLAHQGLKIFNGDFARSLKRAPALAIGGAPGQAVTIKRA